MVTAENHLRPHANGEIISGQNNGAASASHVGLSCPAFHLHGSNFQKRVCLCLPILFSGHFGWPKIFRPRFLLAVRSFHLCQVMAHAGRRPTFFPGGCQTSVAPIFAVLKLRPTILFFAEKLGKCQSQSQGKCLHGNRTCLPLL